MLLLGHEAWQTKRSAWQHCACLKAMMLSQVELYADYEPGRLMSFLVASQAYGLEAAAELCEHRGLVREQVFVLGRMGNARQALHLIMSKLADIPQVPAPFPHTHVICAEVSAPHAAPWTACKAQQFILSGIWLDNQNQIECLMASLFQFCNFEGCAVHAGHRVCPDAAR